MRPAWAARPRRAQITRTAHSRAPNLRLRTLAPSVGCAAVTSHLGLDLGGTNIKWVVLDQDAQPVADGSLPTEREGGPGHVLERLALAGRAAVEATGPIATAGVGVPGIYDDRDGTIRFFTNLPGPWAGHPFAQPLSQALGVPVRLVNDARAFTL